MIISSMSKQKYYTTIQEGKHQFKRQCDVGLNTYDFLTQTFLYLLSFPKPTNLEVYYALYTYTLQIFLNSYFIECTFTHSEGWAKFKILKLNKLKDFNLYFKLISFSL